MQTKEKNLIVDLSLSFALDIIRFTEKLFNRKHYVIAKQLMKSGTSIGANVREAQNAESKADFIHKMKIAAKEADETEYWLLLCKESGLNVSDELLTVSGSIIKVLAKIIASSKKAKASEQLKEP